MFRQNSGLEADDQLDEVSEQYSQPPSPSEERIPHLPFLNPSYMGERDPQLSPSEFFEFQSTLEEDPDDQQLENDNNTKVRMEIEKDEAQNPKEKTNISQLRPETQMTTASTNQSSSETALPTFSNLNPQPENFYAEVKDKKEDETDQVSAAEGLFSLNQTDAWASVFENLQEGLVLLQSQSVEGQTSIILPASKKIQKNIRNETPKEQKKSIKKGNQENEQGTRATKPPERSSEYLNRVQNITKHFYAPFKARQNPVVFKEFIKLLQEALKKDQIDQTVIDNYLIIKRFKMLFFKIEFTQHGFDENYTQEYLDVFLNNDQQNEGNSQLFQNCLGLLRNQFQKIGLDADSVERCHEEMRRIYHKHAINRELVIQNYLRFKEFKKRFKGRCSKNGKDLSNYLRYEIFMSLFEPMCHQEKIDRKAVEEYLVSEIKGGKEGVSKNGKPKEQAKISEKRDLERLLCPYPTDSTGLIEEKAGSRLGFKIFFIEGFYERLIRKIYKKLQGSRDEIKMAYAKKVADLLVKEKENIYKEFLPQ